MRKIKVIVDSHLRLRVADLPGTLHDRLLAICTHNNPQHQKLKGMGFKWNREPKTIATWREAGGDLLLPRGVSVKLRDELAKAGFVASYRDRRSTGGACKMPTHRRELWQHQVEVVEALIERQNCLIRAPTGSGKTTAAIGAAVRIGLPTLIIVWNSALMKQWVVRLIDELGIEADDVGIVRGAKHRIRPFTMAMQQSLWSNPERVRSLSDQFGVVICDEVQRFAARTFLDVIDMLPTKYRVGLSANETRKDRKEFLIYDAFGSVVSDIDQRKLVEKRVVHDVEIRVIPTDFDAPWYVKQKREKKTPDFNQLLDEMMRSVSRNDLLLDVMADEAGQGRRIIAMTQRRDHAGIISSLAAAQAFDCGVMIGGAESEAQLVEATQGLLSGTMVMAAGTYQAIGTGIDLPSVERGVCATPLGSNRQLFGQVRGRFCRTAEGKDDAILFYLWDRRVFGLSHLINLKRWNRNVKVKTADGWQPAQDFIKQARQHGRN
jgi:superfamily II DNA or RNA helicase